MYPMSEHIPNTDIQGTGTRGQRAGGTRRDRTPGVPRAWRWLFQDAGLLLDTGLPSSRWVTFLFAVYYLLLTSPLGKKRSPFPPSSIIRDWRDGLRLWASLSHSCVGRGYLLTPSLPCERATLPGEVHCVIPNRWLLLIVKALWQRTKLCESTPCVHCFFGISTCGEFLCKICYSEAPMVSFKKLFYRIGVNL